MEGIALVIQITHIIRLTMIDTIKDTIQGFYSLSVSEFLEEMQSCALFRSSCQMNFLMNSSIFLIVPKIRHDEFNYYSYTRELVFTNVNSYSYSTSRVMSNE